MKTLLTSLSILMCICTFVASPSFGDERINPIARDSGISSDEALEKLYPPHGVILDQESFTRVWKAWRPTSEIPTVNWKTEMVLVAFVTRPAAPQVRSIRLSDDGDLTYLAPAAKIGGLGFGYCFVHLSNRGIKSVKGTPLSLIAAASAKPSDNAADKIEVTITGTLKTGLAAIGGETTGTIIESGGIEFEIDVSKDKRFARLAKRFDKQKVYLQGALFKMKGIEVGDRLIIIPTLLLKHEAGSEEPVEPVKSAFFEIKIKLSGGFAGLNEELTISRVGKVSNEKKRQRITENWDLSLEQLNELNTLIAETNWNKLEKTIRNPHAADDFQYEFVIETKTKTWRFFRDGSSLSQSPELAKLHQFSKR